MKFIALACAIFLGARAARLAGRESATSPHHQTPLLITTNFSTIYTLTQGLERDVLQLRDDRRSCSCHLRKLDDIAQCRWQFSPDTLLAMVFGLGGLVQPIVIVMFRRQVYSPHKPRRQSLLSQERNVFEQEPSEQRDPQDAMRHNHCVAQMSLQEKEELECDFDEFMRPTTPPYSLTDVTLSPPQ